MIEPKRVFIGYDTRERDAYKVCYKSLLKHSSVPLLIEPLEERVLRHSGLYDRYWVISDQGQFLDVNDGKPFSTEFSFTRFLVPALCQWRGTAVYCDCDFLWRTDVAGLFALARNNVAVSVVKHKHSPNENIKMEGQAQTKYYRKNWSSLVLWNNSHPANLLLTPQKVNSASGQWLHSFGWIDDIKIGEIKEEWNWLSGISNGGEPKAVHFTRGTPSMPGYENYPYASEWFGVLNENR